MPGGRPTKYKEEYGTNAFIDAFIAHCKENKELVSLVSLACYINVSEDTLQEWRKSRPGFSVSLDKVLRTSKAMLVNGGLN